MKHLICALFLLFLFNFVHASDHIDFMGIEVSGDIDCFKDSLLSKGFSFVDSSITSYFFMESLRMRWLN